jgi:CO/xanthine dehydrogenase FAD-binding subunit
VITEYHRPQTLEQALELLNRQDPVTIPLAGGTVAARPAENVYAVVDIQELGLDRIQLRGSVLEVGAAATLQALLARPELDLVLKQCIQLETTYNLRQAASIAGTLVASDGRSVFCTAALALDVMLTVQPGNEQLDLGEMLIKRPAGLHGRLVSTVSIPTRVKLAYQSVSRTPADLPILCVAVARWPSGRTRIALGGFGSASLMAMDGPLADGWEAAVGSACQESGDAWGSAEYRQETAVLLAGRCLADVTA